MTGLTRAQSYQLLYNGEPVEDVLNKLQVSSIAQLRTISGGFKTAILTGYANIFDGGEGLFVWDATSTAADNDGSIVGSGATGRWKRVTDHLTPEMFGAKGNGVDDDAAKLNRCFLAAQSPRLPVTLNKQAVYVCTATVAVPNYVEVLGNQLATIKRHSGMSTALDFFVVTEGASVTGVVIDGSRVVSQAPAEVVLVRLGTKTTINKCTIFGSIGYGIVANETSGVSITNTTVYNTAGYCIAFFGGFTTASNSLKVENCKFFDMGAGAVAVQGYFGGSIKNNKSRGRYAGGPGNRMYVTTNVSGLVTHHSGEDFVSLKPGDWLVLPDGTEHRIISVTGATSMTVSPPPPTTNSKLRAIAGTGDHFGIQSSDSVVTHANDMEGGVTFGTGGGTMTGQTVQCTYCEWTFNKIRNFGKNGINVGQGVGAPAVVSPVIIGNNLIQCGNGGRGTGDSYLLPAYDTWAIHILQSSPGNVVNVTLKDNHASTWTGDLNDGESYLGFSGMDQGSVQASGNTQSGYADGYIRGDILEVILTGYGTGAALTTNVSTGDAVRIAIQTGTTPTASPFFNVRKVIKSKAGSIATGQIVSTTGSYYHCVGLQTSTESNWAMGQAGTPSGSITYHLRG